jgi:hypothetical protein
MIDVVERYYQVVPSKRTHGELSCGQVALTICLFDIPSLNVLHPIGTHEFGEVEQFRIGPVETGSFDHAPLKRPELRSDEALAVVRCKHRPVVVVSQPTDCKGSADHSISDCYLVAPVYSAANYSGEFVNRVRAYEYNTLFYLPGSPDHDMREALIRFDKLQVVCRALLKARQVTLTDDACWCLQEWMQYYQTGALDDVIAEYRNAALTSLTGL